VSAKSGVAVVVASSGLAFVALPALADPSPPQNRPTYNDPGTLGQLAHERSDDAAKKAQRQRPEERAERKESRKRYKHMGRREAADLARQTFAGSFSEEATSVLDMKPGDEIVRYIGEQSAVVRGARVNALASSIVPLRSSAETGAPQPVDLDLVERGGALQPENPLQPTELSTAASSAVTFPGKFALGADGAEGAEAGIEVSNNVFYGGVATDTDMWAMPRYDGANIEWQLRSEDSPESLALGVNLPDRAALVSKGDGSVAVERAGIEVAIVGTPAAFDADGVTVPASLRQAGDHVIVDVRHRAGDFHYPIVVDPAVVLDQAWQGGENGVGWNSFENTTGASTTFSMFFNTSNLGKGYYVRRRANLAYGLGNYGQWEYHSIRNAYLSHVDFRIWNHENANTNSTTGIWAFNTGNWDWNGASRWTRSDTFYGVNAGYEGGQPGNMAVMSLGVPNGGASTGIGTAYMGGAVTYEADNSDPWIGVYRNDIGGGWYHNVTGYIGVDGHDDGGIGVQHMYYDGPGEGNRDRWQGCVGHAASRCPDYWGGHLFYLDSSSMGEGSQAVHTTVWDATARSGSATFPVRIDRTPPDIVNLSGNLYDNRATPITEDTRSLHVAATDGAASPDSAKRSGVKSIEILVDGQRADYVEQGCSESCPMSRDFTWTSENYTNTAHAIKVRVTDQLGHVRESAPFNVQNDGIPPVVQVGGTLWDKDGSIASGLSYGLTVDASEGDAADPESGLAGVAIKVDGQPVYSSSSCAGALCSLTPSWQFRPSDYTDGDHSVEITVSDVAGNMDIETVDLTVQKIPSLASDSGAARARSDKTIDGGAQLDGAGTSVANLGDVNNDEIDDYAVGAPRTDRFGRTDSGTVYVVFGGVSGAFDLASIGPEEGFRINGAAVGDLTGTAVAAAGDVNGDDVSDIAIGAPRGADPFGAVPGPGKVYVVFGNTGEDPTADLDLAALGTHGFEIVGPTATTSWLPSLGRPDKPFGSVIGVHQAGDYETTGDVNGDGNDDLVLGSSDESNNNRVLSGSAYVVFGKASTSTVNVSSLGTGGLRIDGAAADAQAGYAAAIPGDVDADGLGDVLVGAPGSSASGRAAGGAAYVIRGSETPPAAVDLAALGSAGYPVYGPAGDELGSSVSPTGDVDGDLFDDFALGGRNTRVVFGTESTAPMDFGAAAPPRAYTISGPAGGGNVPVLAGGNDLNEDETPELLVGYPDQAGGGSLFAVFGQADADVTSPTLSLDALPGQHGSRLTGAAGDRVGASAAAIDMTPTDLPAVLIGAPAAGDPTASTGNKRLRSGSAYVLPSDKLAAGAQPSQKPSSGRDPDCVFAHGKRPVHNHRHVAFCYEEPSDNPWWRRTARLKRDERLHGRGNGNGRKNLHRRITPGRQSLLDSWGNEIAGIEQTTNHKFILYRPNSSTVVGFTPKHSHAHLQATGRACMIDKSDRKTHALVGLITTNRALAIRGFMRQGVLNGISATTLDRFDTTCGKPTLYGTKARQRKRPFREIPPGGDSGEGAFLDKTDLPNGEPEWDYYQSATVLRRGGCDGNKKKVDCGQPLSNYFEPRFNSKVAYITTGTTGVRGGGIVRGVVTLTAPNRNFRRLDRIEYTDLNVPCQHKFSAHWYFGDANPDAAGASIYGWTPEKDLVPSAANPAKRAGAGDGC
jgi:hypothetical protein